MSGALTATVARALTATVAAFPPMRAQIVPGLALRRAAPGRPATLLAEPERRP
jgi:hypothetical protein